MKPTNNINFAMRRKAAGMTQAQLARAVGISTCEISHYERGVNFPRLERLEKIAAALGCEPRDLI